MSKRDRYDSDDNRYFYEHYEGKDYYEGYSGINTGKRDIEQILATAWCGL
jgi:hypothetical protein